MPQAWHELHQKERALRETTAELQDFKVRLSERKATRMLALVAIGAQLVRLVEHDTTSSSLAL